MTVKELVRSESPSANGQSAKDSRYRIVDADQHVDPPHTFWQDYLPAHLRELAPKIEEGDEHDWVVFEGNKRPLNLLSFLAGKEEINFKQKGKLADLRSAMSASKRLSDMDDDEIDCAVLFGGGPLPTRNSELFIESHRAYNRWLADFVGEAPDRFRGVAYLPTRDVEESIQILREAVKLGLTSVNLPAYPQNPDGYSTSAKIKNMSEAQTAALTGDPSSKRAYWQPEFEPLWNEIVENDVTVTYHLGGRITRFGENDYFLPDHLMSKLAMAEPVAVAIYGGLFDRFPKLRWATIESGVGWMAFAAQYMDHSWGKHRHWVGNENKHPPSFYMDQNIWGSFLRDRIGIDLRHLPGGKNIMWSSDFPHSETTYPHSRKYIAEEFAGIPDADMREIVGGIAGRLFHFD
jgi:predicted TIM-barrel fold metal-dependent hydrolase